jgi:hypothetical protein
MFLKHGTKKVNEIEMVAPTGFEPDGMDSSRDLNGINVPKSPCVHTSAWKEESQ